jgi:hypothetical protein
MEALGWRIMSVFLSFWWFSNIFH